MPTAYTLRTAGPADAAVLRAIYASTRADELALTGWDAAQCQAFTDMQFDAQWAHYTRHWPQAECQLIEVADAQGALQVAGRLWVNRHADGIDVLDISLLPGWRGRGLGGACLRDLQAEAARGRSAVGISVEIGNPARRLYERLGFEPQGAVQGVHQRLAWRAARSQTLEPQT
jgi:ribosomal protein S18 acetylase RimI-like enzyme